MCECGADEVVTPPSRERHAMTVRFWRTAQPGVVGCSRSSVHAVVALAVTAEGVAVGVIAAIPVGRGESATA